jgi:ABC-2 type transport system permease protein
MNRLIHGELIKVRTTRTALAFGAASVLLVLALVLISYLAGDPTTAADKRDALNVGGVLSVPLLIFGIVGATGEYRHRTIAPAVLIAPGRARLTVARLIAYMLTGLLFGVAMLVVALVVGLPLAAGQGGEDLATSDLVTVVGGGLIVAVLTVALGVGVGVLVRNQVAGVVGALIWLFILSPALQLIDEDLPDYTTLPAAGAAGHGGNEEIAFGTAVIVLAAWAAVFFAAGLLLERRRDVD